jgi:hypothetical protein
LQSRRLWISLLIGIIVIVVIEFLLTRGNTGSSASHGAAGPPKYEVAPVSSTLTHGTQVDHPTTGRKANDNPETAIAEAAKKDFAEFLSASQKRLPTKKQAQKLTAKEVHGHPAILNESAVDFGELAEKIEKTPSLKPQALDYYQNCAMDAELFSSVRALCFNRAQRLSVELHKDIWAYDEKKISKDIIELANKH